ncbi:MAG: hypothetical protein V4672_02135 [Verrucomicrobiota bacterium]
MKSRLCLLFITALMAACSTAEEKQTPPVMSQRMSDRIASSRRRMQDQNDRSIYDKAMQSSITNGKDTGGWLGRKNYKSNQFSGSKAYTNTKDFKTGSFAGSSSQSSMGRQSFAQAGKKSSVADTTFKTDSSRFAGQKAREDSQMFSGSDDVFKTGSVRDALRSQQKNETPKFIELEEQKRDPAYSEAQVRRLLGRE